MNATVEFTDKVGYLLVKVNAPWTEEIVRFLVDETKSEAIKRGYQRILLDLTEWSEPRSEMTRFKSGEYLAQVLRVPFKVAAFGMLNAINKFGENVAVNRGAWYRIFPQEHMAIQWLIEGTNKSLEATPETDAPQG